ncbi:WD repeat-containing protein 1 (actin-interacting protein 1) [Marchantia polymorpha subsp. ruderalis]|uniref:Uncharacterized protein n=1 Tax=Marchantia polymorpha TaxID=3197 RepID=A0A2R6XBG0_MARPO|nr:hypothetical protein MARPO_0025s0096 [Marchantia polymorpha]BBN03720.1 hypothetical protein Mp_2g25820 [Marchantia polymorpha subsp. ruderalis]|eukprot:PTQ43412.1 hypothetical protein MARPO_0025s0096 [Marchantia polymorpha]
MAKLRETYAPMPTTERGSGILISGDPKSNYIAYANGRSVLLRSLVNPLEVDVYGDHGYNVTVARISPSGQWVASGDVSGTVRIWARGNDHILRFEIKALSGRIDDLQWSDDGERIAVCGDGKGKTFLRAFMWDSGSNVGEFDGHSKRVLSCSFKPTRPFRIASGGEDFLVNYYEGPPFRFKTSHREHSNFVNCVRYSPDGNKFITVGSDKKGTIYDGKSGEKLGELSGDDVHTGSIYAASWSRDSKQVLTVSADKTAKLWNISADGSGTVTTTFSLEGDGGVRDMQVGCLWLNDYLISISLGGKLSYLSQANPTLPPKVISGHLKSITAITLATNGGKTEIISSSYDAVIIRWTMGTGYLGRLEIGDLLPTVKNLVIADQQVYLYGLDKQIWTATLAEEELKDLAPLDLGAQPKSLDAVVTPKGELALVITDNELVLLLGSKILSKTPTKYTAKAGALSPNGTEAAVGGEDGKVYIYSVQGDTLSEENVLEKHRVPVTTVRFSPDGTMVASGDQSREAVVWSRESGDWQVKVKNMLYHTSRITAIAWSPDSLQVATGSVDTSVYVYDVTQVASTRKVIKGAHLGGVSALAFVDAQTLVTGGDDACLRLWDL